MLRPQEVAESSISESKDVPGDVGLAFVLPTAGVSML